MLHGPKLKSVPASNLKKLADIPKSDRPREKLIQKSAEALSDVELLAVLLGRGIEGHDVMRIAERVLKTLDNNKGKPDIEELK